MHFTNIASFLFIRKNILFVYADDFYDRPLSEYLCKWEVFPLMGVYILIGVYATPLMRG